MHLRGVINQDSMLYNPCVDTPLGIGSPTELGDA